MRAFDKAEHIRQWLLEEVGRELRQCGISRERIDLELQVLASGVSLFLAAISQQQETLLPEQARSFQSLDPFHPLSEAGMEGMAPPA